MDNEEYKKIIMELVKKIESKHILVSIYTVVKNLIDWGENMSIKIKFSYTDEQELINFIEIISCRYTVTSIKRKCKNNGFKKAYLNLNYLNNSPKNDKMNI